MESGECISEFSEIIPSGPLFGKSGTLNFIEKNILICFSLKNLEWFLVRDYFCKII
jgi:hypothetical protein